jgi:hypothetical protein
VKHADDAQPLHRRAWEAIPWLVNGRIAASEREALEPHLRHCADCREELALQQRLRDGLLRQAEPAADADAGLARLWPRIDVEAAMTPAGGRSGAWLRWLTAAVVVQAIALAAVLGANFGAATPQYRTLSAGAPPPPDAIRAVFAAELPLGELQQVLDRAGLRIVDGPTAVGAYTVYTLVPRGPRDAALKRLRSDARVRFAEPSADTP